MAVVASKDVTPAPHIFLGDGRKGLLGRVIKGVTQRTVIMDVDQAWRDVAPAHIDALNLTPQRVDIRDSCNLALFHDERLSARNGLWQDDPTIRERKTSLRLLKLFAYHASLRTYSGRTTHGNKLSYWRLFDPFDMWVALMKRLTPQSDTGLTSPSLDV